MDTLLSPIQQREWIHFNSMSNTSTKMFSSPSHPNNFSTSDGHDVAQPVLLSFSPHPTKLYHTKINVQHISTLQPHPQPTPQPIRTTLLNHKSTTSPMTPPGPSLSISAPQTNMKISTSSSTIPTILWILLPSFPTF